MANGVTRLVGEEGKAFLGPLWTCWKAKEWFLILIYLRSKRRRCLPPIFFHLLPFHLASNTKWQYRGNSKICLSQTSFEKFSAVFTCQRIAKMLVNCKTPFRWKTLLMECLRWNWRRYFQADIGIQFLLLIAGHSFDLPQLRFCLK